MPHRDCRHRPAPATAIGIFFDARFPLAAKARRKEPAATVAQYRDVQPRLGHTRVVVAQFGDNARGIAVIDETATDVEMQRLHEGGMRGLRFRMLEPLEY